MKDPQGIQYRYVLTFGYLHVKLRVVSVYPVFISFDYLLSGHLSQLD